MAAVSETFTPAELFAGDVSEDRRPCTVKHGQVLAANTVVTYDAAGKIIAHDGVITPTFAQSGTTPFAGTFVAASGPPAVLIAAVDATSGDKAGMIYCDGDFIGSKLVWPEHIDGVDATDLLKQKLFAGTDLFATFYNAGEL
jgi:hypothetical protein